MKIRFIMSSWSSWTSRFMIIVRWLAMMVIHHASGKDEKG